MDRKRREILKGAAFASLTAGTQALSGCDTDGGGTAAFSEASQIDAKIDQATIAAAEKIHGLSYTPKERALLVDGLEADLTIIRRVHTLETANSTGPALTFNPKLARQKVGSQKNKITLASQSGDIAPVKKNGDETDVAFASIVQQGAWLRAGLITSIQLTNYYLDRIDTYNESLNCFVTVAKDLAREQAVKADKELAKGRDRGPLHGIPYGLKDLADTKNIPTTWGAEPYKDRIPSYDAEIVRKLRNAGAILLGKTTCGALAYGDLWFGGRTRNPWNPAEGSSGSSAGSAASVVGGLCSFAIGTETLGSIVSPSERCGATGLRPTFGRVSRAGMMALCWSLDKVGPICRHVEDTALVLSELNGYDADDPGAARVGFTYDGSIDVSKMRVGYVPAWFDDGDDVDRRALGAMRDLGVTLDEFPWPTLDAGPLSKIVVVEAAAAFSELTLSERDDELAWQEAAAWPNTWRRARFLSAVDYVQIDRLRRQMMEAMAVAFEGFDALIGPHFAGDALLATNCTGHPQLALRAGFGQTPTRKPGANSGKSVGGETFKTPRGISLWGNLFQEGKIIALGRALEEALDVAGQRPPNFL